MVWFQKSSVNCEGKQADMDINHAKILKVPICTFTLAGLCDSCVQAPEQPDRH